MDCKEGAVAAALKAWRSILGKERVLTGEGLTLRYGPGTCQSEMCDVPTVLLPTTVAEVTAIIAVARRYGVPLYPVSTGKNWGYGDAQPPSAGCAVVDLSGMTRIVDLDEELGLVTLEPGVTQGMLQRFLESRGLRLMVPTTGAGPQCSVVGNALERGHGSAPYTDHFSAVTALAAVLPNGDLYRTPLSALGAPDTDRTYKWGVGPYLDGLFSQGAFGIVVEMTLALARVPEQIDTFHFAVRSAHDLPAVVGALRAVAGTLGSSIGGITLMNNRQILALAVPYPAHLAGPGRILIQEEMATLAQHLRIAAWMGVGAMYGSTPMVVAARSVVRSILEPVVGCVHFSSRQQIDVSTTFGQLLASMTDLLSGIPNETALPLAYWKANARRSGDSRDPGRDGCGVLCYGPLVPMKGERVAAFVSLVERVCGRHGIEPLLMLTTLSERAFDSTISLLFDRRDPEEAKRAAACYQTLFAEGRQHGFLPTRLHSRHMTLMVDPALSFWRLVGLFKDAVDPDGILAPGRYSPLHA